MKSTTTMSPVQQEIWHAFRSAQAWRNASDDALAALIARCRVRMVGRGQCVLFEGEREHIAFVVSGHLRAVTATGTGRRLTTGVAWARETMGVPFVIAESAFPCDVEAGERSVVAIVPATALLELMHSSPSVQMSLLEIAARESIELSQRLAAMNLDVTARVARFVLDRSQASTKASAHTTANLRVSRVELADLLGTVPETLSRAFGHLRDSGIIHSNGGPIVHVLDAEALEAVAAG